MGLLERTPNKTQGDDFARVQSTPVSVSKDDIELLENKILVLESQISKIKKKHMSVLSSGSSDVPQYRDGPVRQEEDAKMQSASAKQEQRGL